MPAPDVPAAPFPLGWEELIGGSSWDPRGGKVERIAEAVGQSIDITAPNLLPAGWDDAAVWAPGKIPEISTGKVKEPEVEGVKVGGIVSGSYRIEWDPFSAGPVRNIEHIPEMFEAHLYKGRLTDLFNDAFRAKGYDTRVRVVRIDYGRYATPPAYLDPQTHLWTVPNASIAVMVTHNVALPAAIIIAVTVVALAAIVAAVDGDVLKVMFQKPLEGITAALFPLAILAGGIYLLSRT